MGIHTTLRQVSLVLAVLCAAAVAEEHHSGPSGHRQVPQPQVQVPQTIGICGTGRYWNLTRRRCVDCTHCSGPGREVTVRPCDGHRDAQCGSVTDLNIDWTWLRDRTAKNGAPGIHERINSLSEAEQRLLRPQHRQHDQVTDFGDDYILPEHLQQHQPQPHKKEKKHKRKKGYHLKAKPKPFGDYDDFADFGASGDANADAVSDDEDLALASWRRAHRHRTSTTAAPTTSTTTSTTPRPTTTNSVNAVEDYIDLKGDKLDDNLVAEVEQSRSDDGVVATSQTFSTAETLIWDWQAGVLVAAVCACLLFFIVAAAYSCQHAWHFKKLKKNLDADMEEISARLALMSGMGSDHLHDPSAPSGVYVDKSAFPVRRGDHLRAGRQQNDYCLATLPRKTRI